MLNFVLIFIGFLLYTFTLGYVTKAIEIKLSKKIKIQLNKVKNVLKSFKKVLHSSHSIYYNIVARMKRIFGRKNKGDDYDRENEKEK